MTAIQPHPSPRNEALVRIERRGAPKPQVEITIDGRQVKVPEGTTILSACATLGIEIPTLCFLETLHPVNVCRICVVELEGARVLVPSCSRQVEPGMVVKTRSERVDLSRKLVLEMLASSVDLSTTEDVARWMDDYGARPERFGPPAPPAAAGERDALVPGHHAPPNPEFAATVAQPTKSDNDLYVRDYGKCILCYKCVEACGPDHQNTFAIAVAGRGFDARISTEFAVPLPESACVYCGNCIAVCPTGALMAKREYDARATGEWKEDEQKTVDTICPYCGVGCTLTLHVQDEEIMKATSPLENSITLGNLCIKGRFGWRYVHGETAKSGDRKGGDRKSGDRKSGDRKSGDIKSGDRKSGDRKGGDRKGGDIKSGDRKSGDRKGGNGKSGDRKGGNRKSGDRKGGT